MLKTGKGENVYTNVLLKICEALDVGIHDIINMAPETEEKINDGEE